MASSHQLGHMADILGWVWGLRAGWVEGRHNHSAKRCGGDAVKAGGQEQVWTRVYGAES